MHTTWRLLAAAPLLVLALAACGPDNGGDKGAGDDTNSQQPMGNSSSGSDKNKDRPSEAEIQKKTEKYQQCLRENGYADGGGQELQSDGPNLSGLEEAAKKCNPLHPWAGQGGAKQAN